MVLKIEICEFQNGQKKNKRIANHQSESVVTNIYTNLVELVKKGILVGEGCTELRVYW